VVRPKLAVSPAEESSKMRQVAENVTRTQRRLARAKIEQEYQNGALDDRGKIDAMIAMYENQLQREMDPADQAELRVKITTMTNRRNGLILFDTVKSRQNEWNEKLGKVDNLKRAGKYAEAYELAQGVYREQQSAYQAIGEKLPEDQFLYNKYNSMISGKLTSISDKMADLAELEQKRQRVVGERQAKENVKAYLKEIGSNIANWFQGAQVGAISYPEYYAAVNAAYDKIEQFRQANLTNPDVLKIIDGAINETSVTLKPGSAGPMSWQQMRDEVSQKMAGGQYKTVLRRVEGENKYVLDYEYADTSEPKYQNYGTITWGPIEVLVKPEELRILPSGAKVYGFRIPQFNGDLSDLTGGSKEWILNKDGRYVPLSSVSDQQLQYFGIGTNKYRLDIPDKEKIGQPSTVERILLPSAKAQGSVPTLDQLFRGAFGLDRQPAGTSGATSMAQPKKLGFWDRLSNSISGLFGQKKLDVPTAQPDRTALTMFQPPKYVPPQTASLPNPLMPFNPTKLSLPQPMNAPEFRTGMPDLPTYNPPRISFGQSPSQLPGPRQFAGVPAGFDILKQGVLATLNGRGSYNRFYNNVDASLKKHGFTTYV
jgi:hypothetical protein